MRYIPYKNIDEAGFISLKSELTKLDEIITPQMEKLNFKLNTRDYSETLGLDYTSEDGEFMGNIGVTFYVDESSIAKPLFKFYVLKAKDKSGYRFYKRSDLNKLFTLEELILEASSVFAGCLSIYQSIEETELKESIALSK